MSVVSDNYLATLDGPEITENIFCFKCDTCNAPSAWEKNEDRCPNCQSILGHLIKCGDEESLKIGLRITTSTQRVIAEARARQVQ